MATTVRSPAAPAAPSRKNLPLIGAEKLKQLYTAMLTCRTLAQSASNSDVPASGRQAARVGVVLGLRPADIVMAEGSADPCMRFLLQQIGGNYPPPTGNSGAPHTTSSLNAAISAALVNRLENNGIVTVLFLSADSLMGSPALEALRIAGAAQLPILYVVENEDSQRAKGVGEKLQDCGFPVIPVEGSDVIAVHRVAQESIARARQGGGPTLIESTAWPLKNGSEEQNDPVRKMETYLRGKGFLPEQWKQQVVAGFGAKSQTLSIPATHSKNETPERNLARPIQDAL